MKKQNYSAVQRLNIVLDKIRTNGPKPLGAALAEIMNIDSMDHYKVQLAYADLLKLAKIAKEEVINVETADTNLHIEPMKRIEAALEDLSVKNQSKQLFDKLDPNDLIHLKHCVYFVGESSSEYLIESERLEEILKEVQELIKEVASAELPKPLRQFVLEQLYNIQRAINLYQINGVRGLKKAIEQIVGAFVYNQTKIKNDIERTSQEERQVVTHTLERFWEILAKTDSVVSLAAAGQQMLPLVIKFISENIS